MVLKENHQNSDDLGQSGVYCGLRWEFCQKSEEWDKINGKMLLLNS